VILRASRDDAGRRFDWLDTEHARGWLRPANEIVGDEQAFERELNAALARGFVAADAAIIARMATTQRASDGADFITDPSVLPQLSWGEQPLFMDGSAAPVAAAGSALRRLDLYAIVDSAQRVQQVLAAGVRTVQLRIKTPPSPDADWRATLSLEVQRSIAACQAAGAELFVNDHWQLAAQLGAHGVHLGQEDLLALGDDGRAALRETGLALGISSHSLWELCRARTLSPRYIACGPVWPTLTKAMPWVPQGLDNLAWWCRMAGVPVVAIGGILEADKVFDAARSGADGVCIVRGLGDEPQQVIPALQAALEAGRKQYAAAPPQARGPHPSLSNASAMNAND
jgi:hydroxymethylpyrimidine kinase / phosphomethylpyrimidine kinase / thiamine-phosphate diphosphorylase